MWVGERLVVSEEERLNYERMKSLYIAAAKAVCNMPALQHMELKMDCDLILSSRFLYSYEYKGKRDAARVEWGGHGIDRLLTSDVLLAWGIQEGDLQVDRQGARAQVARSRVY